jgi:hypothetical protein
MSALSNPAEPLDEFVDLGLRPRIAVMPEIEQIVLFRETHSTTCGDI